MSDIIGRLLDEAEKAQRKGHLLLAEVCRDASDQLGLVMEERDRLKSLLSLAGAKLSDGRLYIGYGNVGPLHDQATASIIQRAHAALGDDIA
jgi:hypothetical protein